MKHFSVLSIGVLVLVPVLTSCGNAAPATPVADPCFEYVEQGKALERTTDTKDKVAALTLAHYILGSPKCFDPELVAASKTLVTVMGRSNN